MKPYKDTFLNRNTRIRRFKQSVSSEELVWHRDRSDRVVKIVEGSGWQLQMDNGLPEKLVAGKEYHIPANNYHRLIKGKTDLVAEIKEEKMKITRRQLRTIIKEAIDVLNNETGEVMVFDDNDGGPGTARPDAPEAAAMDMMKRLGVLDDAKFETGAFPEFDDVPTYSLPDDKWEMMHQELYGKRAARKSKADKKRLDIGNLMDRVVDWGTQAGREYLADNRGARLEDIAFDLAQAAEMEFKPDEWNELLYHFGFEEDDLNTYIADVIASAG